jgi:hypothetical protein
LIQLQRDASRDDLESCCATAIHPIDVTSRSELIRLVSITGQIRKLFLSDSPMMSHSYLFGYFSSMGWKMLLTSVFLFSLATVNNPSHAVS